MKRNASYIAVAVLVLAGTLSCRRSEEPGDNAGNGLPYIQMGGGMVTKGLLNQGGLDHPGTTLKVYDYLSEFTGEIDGNTYTNATTEYFTDMISYDSQDADWDYISGNAYRWTKTGTHNFFGWLTLDKSSDKQLTDIIPDNVSFSNRILTVPATTITSSSEQFDFSFSKDIVVRPAANKDYSKVNLQMGHLLAAISLSIENKSSGPVNITSITMPGLPTKRGASIDFSGNATGKLNSYTTPEASTPFFTNQFGAGVTIASGEKRNVYTGAVVPDGSDPDYKLTWPLDSTILAPSTANPYAGISGNRYKDSAHNPADSLIRLSYSYTMTVLGVEQTIVRNDIGVAFPSHLNFEEGKLYDLLLTVNDKVIQIDFKVQEWDFNEYSLEFTNDAATVPDKLTFIENTYDHKVDDTYYTNGASPIKGKFRITNPVGARLRVAPKGDTQYFTVTMSPEVIDPTVDNGEIEVTVTPNTSHGTPTESKTLKFEFYMVNGTRETSINSEVNYEDVTVIWAN